MKYTWKVQAASAWHEVAVDVASRLRPGDILALQGLLGAGKTTFVQALAHAMGAKKVPKSPTFSMLRTYEVQRGTIRRLLHVDAYRIEDERDLLPLDLDEELTDGNAVLVLEWPENVKKWLAGRRAKILDISITKDGRRAVLRA